MQCTCVKQRGKSAATDKNRFSQLILDDDGTTTIDNKKAMLSFPPVMVVVQWLLKRGKLALSSYVVIAGRHGGLSGSFQAS